MITVTVSICGSPIITRSARNITKVPKETGLHQYLCDDGKIIKHMREDGAAILAIKMLNGVKDIVK